MLAAGGRMVDFHGWEMPVQFAGILVEHRAVRQACGLFDVSHMGEVFVSGKDAHRFVERINCNRMTSEPGRGTYSHLLAEDGGILDDAITFCLAPDRFLAVVNAATDTSDWNWMRKQAADFDVELEHASARMGMLAVQGPNAPGLVADLFPGAVDLPRFGAAELPHGGLTAVVTRTGYTGEDGFEIILPNEALGILWDELLDRGAAAGLAPCGLGSRDTLRLEAGYLLYGVDADAARTPYEAGCGWVVKPRKGDFIGREALERRKAAGFREKLTGVRLKGRGVPRAGCRVLHRGTAVGELTSATFAPTLGTGIGVGYLESCAWEPGTEVQVEIHGKLVAAETVKGPFRSNSV